MAYFPIKDYGVIGDMRTLALVSKHASIDWLCLPRFDSPSVFAAILDDQKGGYFRISPKDQAARSSQNYIPGTNVLVTTFKLGKALAALTDFMPAAGERRCVLIRRLEMTHGSMTFRGVCLPAFDYARAKHTVRLETNTVHFNADGFGLVLQSSQSFQSGNRGKVMSEFTLMTGEVAWFVLSESGGNHKTPSDQVLVSRLEETLSYWRQWESRCTYTGRWREHVRRSALVLKLLTYEATGAVVAAGTTSLPEALGGKRNWDYRFCWIRDACFTLNSLLRVGFTEEASRFLIWLEDRFEEPGPTGPLPLMFDIDGRTELNEVELHHLDGYKHSRPVRIGNGAHGQLQLDIAGELLDLVWSAARAGSSISPGLRAHLRILLDWVCQNWRRPDEGIWEVRGPRKHFTYSKLMCWLALDRGLNISLLDASREQSDLWRTTRETISRDILRNGWSARRNAFVQHYSGETLDAATLMASLVSFLPATDHRILSTIDAIRGSYASGGLVEQGRVYRYNEDETADGLSGHEGAFNICTFWLVRALAAIGKIDQAREHFKAMLASANHLGLLAEETGHDGEALGNFPQAFSHLALIDAAFALDHAKEGTLD